MQILLIFLQKMDLLLTKTPGEDIKNSVLPMVYRALEAPSVQIQVKNVKKMCDGRFSSVPVSKTFSAAEQELCLNIIPTFANLIDYPSMKNALIPRIKSACLQTSSLAVSQISAPIVHSCVPKHGFNASGFASVCVCFHPLL